MLNEKNEDKTQHGFKIIIIIIIIIIINIFIIIISNRPAADSGPRIKRPVDAAPLSGFRRLLHKEATPSTQLSNVYPVDGPRWQQYPDREKESSCSNNLY